MNLFPAIIQTNLYLLIVGLAYLLVFRHVRHFRANRFFLIGGVVLSLILPWINLKLPLFTSTPAMTSLWTAMPADHAPAVPVTDVTTSSAGNSISPGLILLLFYLLVVILILAGIILQLTRQVVHHRQNPSFRSGLFR